MSALPTPPLRLDGEMGARIAAYDWSATAIGDPSAWPQPLKTLVTVMFGSTQPMFVAWGPGHTLFYNDAYATVLANKHPALGQDFLEVWHEIRADLEPLVAMAYRGEPTRMDDLRLLTLRKGRPEVTHWAYSYTPVHDESGAVAGFFCVCNETTEQVLNQRRRTLLLALDERLRDEADTARLSFAASRLVGEALEVVRVGYGVIDAEAGTIAVERNWSRPGFADVAGVHRFGDYGSHIEDLLRGYPAVNTDVEQDPRSASSVGAFRALGIAAHLDVPITENGRAVADMFVHSDVPRIWTDDEIALVREVTERTRDAIARRMAERELREANARLEERVRERTAALEAVHEQLRQSQKMEAVGQLTGGLAHDFNNLLAGISGSLELIQSRLAQGRTAEVDKYVTAAQGAANRAAALTHRLLAFSRRQTLAPKPTDVNRLTAGMTDLVRRTVGPNIQLELVTAEDLWSSLIDPSQLENAVLNLCINARDAMPEGGTITIETANHRLDDRAAEERGVRPGAYISLCVTDTGVGMTPEVAAKAFDPFFTTKPIGVGTGLGLSMIYGFAKQSGGAASIDTAPGEGTRVCIHLPRSSDAANVTAEAEEPEGAPRGAGETVLVIDDEPTLRMLVAEVLADLGYTSIEAEDGAGGLEALGSSARVDLLVTDVGLPGNMNGRQVADAARVLRPELKVLFITGYAENAVLSDGHLPPGMHVATKPFTMDGLARRIRDIIESPSPTSSGG